MPRESWGCGKRPYRVRRIRKLGGGGRVQGADDGSRVAIKIPLGVNSGRVMGLKGKGMVNQKTTPRGDQLVKLTLALPDTIDKELADFMERWGKTRPNDVRGKAGMR